MSNLPMLTDNAPILARELKRVKDLFREADRLESGIERFEDVDAPEYAEWHEANFGDQMRLERLRRREFLRLAHAHDQVVSLAEAENLSMRSAWRRYRAEEERYARGDEPTRDEIDELRRAREARFELPEDDPEFDDFESLDGESESTLNDQLDVAISETEDLREGPLLRIHSLFRIIVRQIHPDSRDPALHKKKPAWFDRIWARTLRAKERGDLAEMVVIHGRILMATRALESLNLADLRQLNASLSEVHSQRLVETHALRQHRSWNFSKLKSKKSLTKLVARTYAASVADLERKIAELLSIRRGWMRA